MWPVRETSAKSILTPVSGFLRTAGFTHSLTPARNCTYGCTYCYVPTMGIYGGLKPEDWKHWGEFTTVKVNAAELARKESRPGQIIYCSPLVDPYQPVEAQQCVMPALLEAVTQKPPAVFVIQTRGPLILRDIALLQGLSARTTLRVSFSITTDRDDVRKRYEPHCESNQVRLDVVRQLRSSGIETYATLAPLLPCDPERLATLALDASGRDLVGDPFHVRQTKRSGATTREPAARIADRWGEQEWFEPEFQAEVIRRIEAVAKARKLSFSVGPAGFSLLARAPGLAGGGDA